MEHEFGGVLLPIQSPHDGDALTDPALDFLGSYLKAVLTAWAGTAWLTRAPGEPIVRTVLVVDPRQAEFIETDLPALYLSRTEVATIRLSEDHTATRSKIEIGWVPPPKLSGARWAQRATIINGVAKVIAAALTLDRHPSWVLTGDPDALAATEGSVWMRFCGFVRKPVGKTTTQPLEIAVDGGKPLRYSALQTVLENVEEHLELEVTKFPGIEPSSVDLSVVTPDYLVTLQRAIA
jgi:hypothetical protein